MKNNIEIEIWKAVRDYEGVYSISNLGRVRRDGLARGASRGRILKLGKHAQGYLSVGLSKSGSTKTFLVHILVAKAFLRVSTKKTFVNHKNGRKHDNRSSNLEWVTRSQNMRHAIESGLIKGYIKISPEQLTAIHKLRSKKVPVSQIASTFDIGLSYTYRLLKGARRPLPGGN